MDLVTMNAVEQQQRRTLDLARGSDAGEAIRISPAPEVDVSTDSCSTDWSLVLPLPEHTDPAVCRDAFLSSIIHEHRESNKSKHRSVKGQRESEEAKNVTMQRTSDVKSLTGEALLMQQFMKREKKTSTIRKTVAEHLESIRIKAEALMELDLNCQKAAMDFLIVRLRKQLKLFSNPLPGNIDDVPHNLFRWSVDFFEMRLPLNQLYLDVIQMERSKEDLDCIKFRTDLEEIAIYVTQFQDMFRKNEDFCTCLYGELKGADYINRAPWVASLHSNLASQLSLPRASQAALHGSSIRAKSFHNLIMSRFEDSNALDPIELRYQVNWIQSCAEQRMLRLQLKEQELTKNLEELELNTKTDSSVQYSMELTYMSVLEMLKGQIDYWQNRFDTDLEKIELLCAVNTNKLSKYRDDLEFNRGQEKMFKTRIEEVRILIAQEVRKNLRYLPLNFNALLLGFLDCNGG
ncbi:hypothetical protein KR018_000732 [Drosophila ironensis]|nr:hypothetical protein KR018_000732 [Drosophila ironensis]